MFEIPKKALKALDPAQQPAWLSTQNETIKQLFRIALNEELAIREKIEAGEDIGTRSRKISLRKLSEAVGKNSTYLNSRDYPEFSLHIENINSALENEYAKRDYSTKPPKTNDSTIDAMSRAELLDLAKAQRDELNQLKDLTYTNQLMHLMDSGLFDNQKRNSIRIKDYQNTINSLQADISITRSRMQETDESMIQLINENQELKRLLAEAGIKTKPKLKSV